MVEIMKVDRISELPEFIIHHIMSFLKSPKKLVRMSVLSKKWFAITASFPILHFHNWDAREFSLDDSVSSEYFFKYIDYTTTRFCEQNVVSAHTFSLYTPLHKPSEVDVVDRCLRLILTKGVQVLDISTIGGIPSEVWMYRLPDILLSVSSLTSLKIGRCKLPSSLMLDDVKFKSLKLLEITGITIDEEVIKRLTTSCPLLEEFNVRYCNGFKTFCVYGLEHLQKIEIFCHFDLERIDIEARNLWSFSLFDLEGKGAPCMNLALCKKLTRVGFFNYSSNGFANLLSNFPFVKDLVLTTDKHSKKLKLSSDSLTALVLHSHCSFEDIEINTPNLLLFKYLHDSSMCDLRERNLVESKPRLECYTKDDVDTLWFLKLERFLDKKNSFKVLKLHINANSIDVEELKAIQSQPYELDHVELIIEATKEFFLYAAVVEAVLLCYRPKSLSLSSKLPFSSLSLERTFQSLFSELPLIDFEERNHAVKCIYEKLLLQEEQSQTNLQMVLTSYFPGDVQHFSNLDSLLEALPIFQVKQTITFVKEKVIQEARSDFIRQRSVNLDIA